VHGGQRPCSWFYKGLLEEAFAGARSIITFRTMQGITLTQLSRPCRHPAVVALLSSAATILLWLALAAWHTSSYTQSHPHLLYRKFLAERAGCADQHEQAQTGTVTLQSSDGRCSAMYIGLFCPVRFIVLHHLYFHPNRDRGDGQLQAHSTWPGSRCMPTNPLASRALAARSVDEEGSA